MKNKEKMSQRYRWSLFEGDRVAEIHKKKGGKYKKVSDLYITKNKKSEDKITHKDLKNVHSKRQLEDVINTSKLTKIKKRELLDALEVVSNESNNENIKIEGKNLSFPNNKYCIKPVKREYDGSERECIYITGVSGSGKSRWISDYLDDYKRKFPDNEIVVFSNVDQDECLDRHSPIRIDKEKLIDEPIEDLEELNNTCCIFDDTASIPDKKLNKEVQKVRDMILEKGRHHNITCLVTSHIAMDGNPTKYPIRESHNIVSFPEGNETPISNLMQTYCGMKGRESQNILEKVKDRDYARWNLVSRRAPKYVLFKRSATII